MRWNCWSSEPKSTEIEKGSIGPGPKVESASACGPDDLQQKRRGPTVHKKNSRNHELGCRLLGICEARLQKRLFKHIIKIGGLGPDSPAL
jgi:hypothetical protein